MADQESEMSLIVYEFKKRIFWGINIRYAVVFVGLLMLGLAAVVGGDGAALGPGALLLASVFLYNFIAHFIYQVKSNYKVWQVLTFSLSFLLLDILAITFLIYLTGWLESPYWFLYLVMIIVSGFGAFFYYSISVFFIAFFSAFFYLGLLLLAFYRVLPIYGPDFNLPPEMMLTSIFNRAIFTTVSFFLFAATIYYFSKLVNEHRAELLDKNRQLLTALEDLKRVDRLKDEFIANTSHELRTPLSVVREDLSLIEDGAVGEVNDRQKKLLGTSRVNIDRLARILDNVLDISRIESRSLLLNRQKVDLRELAAKALELLKGKAAEKKIALEKNVLDQLFAQVDSDQIIRVFINLLDNAIKYTGEGGRVVLGLARQGEDIKGYVLDTGIGIAKKDQSLIFDRFVSLHAGEEVAPKSAGLGLSICKGIIEMHGGKLWVESELGQGAKFIFILPAAEGK